MSVQPKNLINVGKVTKVIMLNTIDAINSTLIAVPTDFLASLFLPSPKRKLNLAAQPLPIIRQ